MINQGNPFYGNNYMSGISYAPQTGNYVAQTHAIQNPYSVPTRFQSIPGRLVNNLDEITPQEVPMDGSVSLFPQNDYSAIYAKTWTKDGTIATMKYIPEQPQVEPQKSPIEERLDNLNRRFDKLEKMLSNRNKYHSKPKPVKEETADVE